MFCVGNWSDAWESTQTGEIDLIGGSVMPAGYRKFGLIINGASALMCCGSSFAAHGAAQAVYGFAALVAALSFV